MERDVRGVPQGYEAVHEALTDAFPRAKTAKERARWKLTDEQVDRFHQRGFLLDLPLLDASQIAELRARLNHIGENIDELKSRLYEVEESWQQYPDEVVLHLLGVWLVDPWFHDLVFHPGVSIPLAQLLGVEEGSR